MAQRPGDSALSPDNRIGFLRQFITPARYKRFEEVLHNRTRQITVVLEDIYQPHNASAVLRTCDCFGIQDVHIIENRNRYQVNPDVALGSYKWLTLNRYNQAENNTASCLETLKRQGYRLVATTPHRDDHTPETLPLDRPAALIFGTELEGLTPAVLGMADDYLRIPMYGFTESLNISVSAAILLRGLVHRLHQTDAGWRLSEPEKEDILLSWLKASVKESEQLLEKFVQEGTNPG